MKLIAYTVLLATAVSAGSRTRRSLNIDADCEAAPTTCHTTAECVDHDTNVATNKLCKCPTDTHLKVDTVKDAGCVKDLVQACTADADCDAGAECKADSNNAKKCTCKAGYDVATSGAKDKPCLEKVQLDYAATCEAAGKNNQVCDVDDAGDKDNGMKCVDNSGKTCVCDTLYFTGWTTDVKTNSAKACTLKKLACDAANGVQADATVDTYLYGDQHIKYVGLSCLCLPGKSGVDCKTGKTTAVCTDSKVKNAKGECITKLECGSNKLTALTDVIDANGIWLVGANAGMCACKDTHTGNTCGTTKKTCPIDSSDANKANTKWVANDSDGDCVKPVECTEATGYLALDNTCTCQSGYEGADCKTKSSATTAGFSLAVVVGLLAYHL